MSPSRLRLSVRHPARRLPLLAALLLSPLTGLPTLAHAADDSTLPAVTPYRPSLSNPAQLPAPGQLELETGILHGKSADGRRDSLPYQLKLAFDPNWGLVMNGDAFVSATDSGGKRARGVGDTNLILKRAFLIDDATGFGLELGVKLPTARDDIGTGRADQTINGIFSRDIGTVHMDANLNLTHVGLAEPGTGSMQTGLSASFSHPFSDKFAATAEGSAIRRPGTASTAQVLLALTYSPTRRLTFDIGVIRGLNPASTNLALFTGFVMPIAQLW